MGNLSAVILAAGEGKRMKSDKPKPLSEVLGKPILSWVLDSLKSAGIDNICVVTGYKRECIEQYLSTLPFKVETTVQAQRLGTGHAVMTAEAFLKKNGGDVIILNGDAPFMDCDTIKSSLKQHISDNNSATVISAKVCDPSGYGRILRDSNGRLQAIVEHKDCTQQQLMINEINSGGYWFNCADLLSVLGQIKSNNQAGEYYLTDAIELLLSSGKNAGAYTAKSSDTVLGANDPQQLEQLNIIARQRLSQ